MPILLENTCVLLMGVLSTFLVSWLGKEAFATAARVRTFCEHLRAIFRQYVRKAFAGLRVLTHYLK